MLLILFLLRHIIYAAYAADMPHTPAYDAAIYYAIVIDS